MSDRIFAYLIDIVIMVSITLLMVVIFIYAELFDESSPFLGVLVIVPAFFYHLALEVTMQGQSIGKRMLHIKVVKLDGSQPNLGNYLLRWLIWPLDTFFYGGIAILCFTIGGKGQRLGDIAAGTTVISLKRSGFLKQHTLSTLSETYQPVFSNADQLPGAYMELIHQALKAHLELLDARPIAAISAKVKEKLKVTTDIPDIVFLHTIIKDYNYLLSSESKT